MLRDPDATLHWSGNRGTRLGRTLILKFERWESLAEPAGDAVSREQAQAKGRAVMEKEVRGGSGRRDVDGQGAVGVKSAGRAAKARRVRLREAGVAIEEEQEPGHALREGEDPGVVGFVVS